MRTFIQSIRHQKRGGTRRSDKRTHGEDMIRRTLREWFHVLYIIIDLIYEHVPVGHVSATFLKVLRFYDVLKEHGVQMEGIVRAP